MSKTNRKWLGVRLPDTTLAALNMRASSLGRHPSDLAAILIEQQLIVDVSDDPSVEYKIWLKAQEAKRKDIVRSQLEHIAFVAMRDGDEETLEDLKGLCAESGADYEGVMDGASRFSSKQPDNSTMSDTVNAIYTYLKGGPMPASETMRAVKDQTGASETTINRAKRDIGVQSYKDSATWMWMLEGASKQQVQ